MASDDDKTAAPGKTGDDGLSKRSTSPPPTIDLKSSDFKDETKVATGNKADSAAAGAGDKGDPTMTANTANAKEKAPPPQKSSGFGGVTTATIGGIIGGLIVFLLAQLGILPQSGASNGAAVAAIGQSISDLEAKIDSIGAREVPQAVDLGPLETELTALQAQVEALRAGPAGDGGDMVALGERISTLEALSGETGIALGTVDSRLAAIEETPAGGGEAALTVIEDRLAALEAAPAGNATGADMSGLSERIEAVDASIADRIASALAAVPNADLAERFTNLDERVAAADNRLSAVFETVLGFGDTLGPLGERVARLDESLSTLGAASQTGEKAVTALSAAVDENSAGLADMSSRVETVAGNLSSLGDQVAMLQETEAALDGERRAAYLVALSGLQRAAAGSGPFRTELDAVLGLGGGAGAFAGLNDYADNGVASVRTVADSFNGLTGTILDETAKASADGVMSRLAASAQTLVRIRPTGYVAGDTPSATVARIEALLGEGKLAEALKEWETLPEAGKTASKEWAKTAESRLALDHALAGSAGD